MPQLPLGYKPKKKIWTKGNIGHVGGKGPVTQGLLDYLNTGVKPKPKPKPKKPITSPFSRWG